MKPPPIIAEIENLLQITLYEAPARGDDTVSGVMPYKEGRPYRYALRNGKLAGLNLAGAILDDDKWKEILQKIGPDAAQLEALNLRDNQLTASPLPGDMPKLRYLDLCGNQVREFALPPGTRELEYIWLYGNKTLTDPPREIVSQGNEAILQYFRQLQREQNKKDTLFEAKLLIIGEAGAGKTTFSRRLQKSNAVMPKREESTHGINIDRWTFPMTPDETEEPDKEAIFHVNLWDFGGQESYHGTHQFFFSEHSLYVLLADTREQKTDFGYWLNTVEQLAGEKSSLFILLNKRENHNWKIDEHGLRLRFGEMLRQTMTVDLSIPEELPPLQERICYWMKNLPEVGQDLIESWVRIREDLAKESAHFISFDRFRDICRAHGQTELEDVRLISRYFHRIGVFTHYIDEPALQDRVWLDSNWLCKTVYRLLEDEMIAALNGRLTKKDVEQVWKDNELRFEVGKLTSLLSRFGLMYQAGKDEFIVPEHLPQQQPYARWPMEGDGNLLHFRYRFDKYMPKGLMSGLIVALHRYIPDHSLVWNRGVNLAFQGAHAEIVEQYGGVNQFDIRIAGTMQRDLLVIITQEFDKILDRFAKLRPEKGIKCPCNKCATDPEPYFHNTEDIENALIVKAHKPNPTVECKKSFEDILVRDLLAVINFEKVLRNVQEKTQEGSQFALKFMEEMRFEFKAIHGRFDEQDDILTAQFETLKDLSLKQVDEAKLDKHFDEIKILLESLAKTPEFQDIISIREILEAMNNKSKTSIKVVGTLLPTVIQEVLPLVPNIQYEMEINKDLGSSRFIKELVQRFKEVMFLPKNIEPPK